MADPARIPAPNYTQIPNVVLDLMADMSDAELRVVIAIARQTFGWHKKRDKISLSQLAKLTGMSRQGVINGLEAGTKRGLIERTPDESDRRGGIWYRLLVNDVDQSSRLTSYPVDQSTPLTITSQPTRPDLVNGVDTQKKGKENKERERGTSDPDLTRAPSELAITIADVCKINPKVATQKQRQALNEAYTVIRDSGATPDDVRARERWWYANDWRAKKENRPPRPVELQEIWDTATASAPKPTRPIAAPKIAPPADARPAPEVAAKMAELLARKRGTHDTS